MRKVGGESSLSIRVEDGRHVLEGAFDEFSDLSPLLSAKSPLKLDLKLLQAVSSIGVRKWLQFLKDWGDKTLELYGCAPPFVSILNAFPPALGEGEKVENVKSVMVPFSCEPCNQYLETEVTMRTVKMTPQGIVLPTVSCPGCGSEARLVTDPDEYFVFLTWG